MTEPDAEANKPLAIPLSQEARQKAIDVLSEAYAQDQIDVEEFEQRVELVGLAKNMEHLRTIVADLPPPPAGPATTAAGGREVVLRPTLPPGQVPDDSVIVGIMGGGSRKGAWIPARTNWAVALMGACDLDFREAQLGPGVTEIRTFAIMGGVQVVVPPDVRVECSGIGIMGGFDHKTTVTSTTDLEAPVIRVTGLAIMGGVEVTVRHPGETARDARLRLSAERKAQKRLAKGK